MRNLNWIAKTCAAFLIWTAVGGVLAAQTYTVLHSFDLTDGRFPNGALLQGTRGKLHGTTSNGGANGSGTIFEITTAGDLTTIYNFCSQNDCADGSTPNAGLLQISSGDFYGVAAFGGIKGAGTAFSVTVAGAFTPLYTFCSKTNCADGMEPNGSLIEGINGNFYGTTAYGGGPSCVMGCGTIFSITTTGKLQSLHKFDGTDGDVPLAGLTQGTGSSLFGTTYYGGAQNDGTVFTITTSGDLTTLYNFCPQNGCADGANPSGLIMGTDGSFYGTTMAGGASLNGTVFMITAGGKLKTLHSFENTEGENPAAGLIQGSDGNFYGTTYYGGMNRNGTIFEITPSGAVTTLYNFCMQANCADGANPNAALVQDTDGDFYGTTLLGGANNEGTVFSLSTGLGAFVKTLPTAGNAGEPVDILGTNLTGATNVTFHGTAATFTVVSSSEIKTTVPAGTTTGPVKVVTPAGTLISNIPFTIEP